MLMRAHFKETELIRIAVINGNLSKAVGPAKKLAASDEGKKLKKGGPALAAMKKAASRIGTSVDIPAAAAATADIGKACGACHRKGAGPKVEVSATPTAGKSLKSRMRRHVWATDRLWEGLYGPSEAAWKAGAEALSGEPFPKAVYKKGGVHARSAADRLKRLVGDAATQKTPDARAKMYASLLETCSSCHFVSKGN